MIEVLKFGASWCHSCNTMKPIFNKVSQYYVGTDVQFKDIDVETDEGVELSSLYQVRNVPTILIIKNDRVIERISGTKTEQQLTEIIDKWK